MNDATENKTTEFTPSPVYLARQKRVQDALELRKPDRIPILLGPGYLIAEMGNITHQELHNNPEKRQEILEELALYFQPDMIMSLIGSPQASMILGDRMTKWPGYGLGPEGSFQFDEKDFMKAEDYDALLEDPSDFAIRTYLPRAFKTLEGFSMLPPLAMWLFGYYNLMGIASMSAPPIIDAFEALNKVIQIAVKEGTQAMASNERMAELGFPPNAFMGGCLVEAPFDFMSDTLRGMRGIFLDMMRQPDKLLAAQEKVKRIMMKSVKGMAEATGIKSAGIPLHRGSDGFMSIKHFEEFYWPQLKDLVLQLIDLGLTVFLFYEGVWDKRLEYLNELPRGKTIGLFQASNIFKVKEIVGDNMCILGGMPVSMLSGGSESQVREYTHELCERVGKNGGYIMTTGVLELEGCDPAFVKAWIDATKEYGVYV